ncbi:rhamnan synthesis F family protein [Porticoccaceae bacterium]|nr:rhamnan synthesis F family protein [Porticoccaceae bacterium]
MKLALIYHYYELNDEYRDNLIHFVSKVWSQYLDLYIVVAGHSSVSIPVKKNIHILTVENKNNDYGGYSDLVNSGLLSLDVYDLYIFINSSVRGPFLPDFVETDWTDLFFNKIQEGFGLVGITMNELPANSKYSAPYFPERVEAENLSHIQTTVYALSKEALNYLVNTGFYAEKEFLSKNEVVANYEVGLTKILKSGGFRIVSLIRPPSAFAKGYQNNFSSDSGDILSLNGYYCRTLSPYELLFVKVNRGLLTRTVLTSITFTSLINSEDKIGFWDAREILKRRLSRELIQINFWHKIIKWVRARVLGLKIRFQNLIRRND